MVSGNHTVKSYAKTQMLIALSSGEAELYGVVKGSAAGLGFLSLLVDLGVRLRLRIWTDSTASQGICSRQRLGKVRHLDVQELWVQHCSSASATEISNSPTDGEIIPGDLLTKGSLTQQRISHLLSLLRCEYREGRPEAAPALRQGGPTKDGGASA